MVVVVAAGPAPPRLLLLPPLRALRLHALPVSPTLRLLVRLPLLPPLRLPRRQRAEGLPLLLLQQLLQ